MGRRRPMSVRTQPHACAADSARDMNARTPAAAPRHAVHTTRAQAQRPRL
jgi:hypothetical protein